MATTSVTLNPVRWQQVRDMVEDGQFSSVDEAVDHLLSIAIEEPQTEAYSPEVMAHLDEGVAQIRRGEVVSQAEVEAFFDDWGRNG